MAKRWFVLDHDKKMVVLNHGKEMAACFQQPVARKRTTTYRCTWACVWRWPSSSSSSSRSSCCCDGRTRGTRVSLTWTMDKVSFLTSLFLPGVKPVPPLFLPGVRPLTSLFLPGVKPHVSLSARGKTSRLSFCQG